MKWDFHKCKEIPSTSLCAGEQPTLTGFPGKQKRGTLLSALEKKQQALADFGVSISIRTVSEKLHTRKYKEVQHSVSQSSPVHPSTGGVLHHQFPPHFPAGKNTTHKKISSLYLTLLGFGPKEELVEQKCKLTLWRSAWDSTRQFFCTHKNHIKSVQALKRTSSSFSQIMSLTG